MRLIDLLEDISAYDLKRIEKALDAFVYQPEEKIKKSAPVLDVDIPTNKDNHFVQRLNQRSEVADIPLGSVYNLMKNAKVDQSLGFKKELDDVAREDNPDETIVLQDIGKHPLTIPVKVVPNPDAVKTSPNNPVGVSKAGQKVPKNKIIPKTVYRKGIDD